MDASIGGAQHGRDRDRQTFTFLATRQPSSSRGKLRIRFRERTPRHSPRRLHNRIYVDVQEIEYFCLLVRRRVGRKPRRFG